MYVCMYYTHICGTYHSLIWPPFILSHKRKKPKKAKKKKNVFNEIGQESPKAAFKNNYWLITY